MMRKKGTTFVRNEDGSLREETIVCESLPRKWKALLWQRIDEAGNRIPGEIYVVTRRHGWLYIRVLEGTDHDHESV